MVDDTMATPKPPTLTAVHSYGDAIPKEVGDVAVTLETRLKAWKHVVGNLQEYVEQHENLHKSMAKEYEKVGKVCISNSAPTIYYIYINDITLSYRRSAIP